MADVTQANCASYTGRDPSRLITAQMLGQPNGAGLQANAGGFVSGPVSGEPHGRADNAIRIPDDLVRNIHGLAEFLESQGGSKSERLAKLRKHCDGMSHVSRESVGQLLDFVVSVLAPLSTAVPPRTRRRTD
jgi:hypothetical protein